MKLKVLGSTSKGNCYILESTTGEMLIIEAGIKFDKVKEALLFNLNKVHGAIVSHQHGDHAKYIGDFLKAGIKTVAPSEAFPKDKQNNIFAVNAVNKATYELGSYRVKAFELKHDCKCFGYLITHYEIGGNILFITDTMLCKYKFPNVCSILIEANYSDSILTENINNGIEPVSMRERLYQTHMELQTTIDTIKANKTAIMQDVVLLHLSSRNSNAEAFKEKVSSAVGLPVEVAEAGAEIWIGDLPF